MSGIWAQYLVKSQNSQPVLDIPQTFSGRLREERVRACPKQLDFAKKSRIDNTTLSALEHGKQNIRADHLEALSAAGIDILYVVTGKRGGNLLGFGESLLVDAFQRMSSSAQAALLNIAMELAGQGGHELVVRDEAGGIAVVEAKLHSPAAPYRHATDD